MNKEGKLEVTKTPNAENPWCHGATPILTMDVSVRARARVCVRVGERGGEAHGAQRRGVPMLTLSCPRLGPCAQVWEHAYVSRGQGQR